MMYWGMQLPLFQVGDTVRAGHGGGADSRSEELGGDGATSANWTAAIWRRARRSTSRVVALPGKDFTGKVKSIGGTGGPPWDRHFECKITLDNPSPELRPGMSANMVITTERLDERALGARRRRCSRATGAPSSTCSGADGFVPHDVKLVRRSESQVVIDGLNEGAGGRAVESRPDAEQARPPAQQAQTAR